MWDRERGNVVTFELFNGCFVSGNLRQLSHYPVRFFPSHTKPLALCKHRSQTSIITHGVWMRESTFQFSPILTSMQYPEYADHHVNRWETSITALPLVFSLVAGEWHWPQGTGLPQKIPGQWWLGNEPAFVFVLCHLPDHRTGAVLKAHPSETARS